MSSITYFPRYSSRENKLTNTTLHLLHQLYHQRPYQFFALISDLLDGNEIPLGISFAQQIRRGNSVPDGMITQEHFQLCIETKDSAGVNIVQLKNHCDSFTNTHGFNYLLLLTRNTEDNSKIRHDLQDTCSKKNIVFISKTFDALCDALKNLKFPDESYIGDIVDDYVRFCGELNLVKKVWLRIVPCGLTFHLNAKHCLYSQPNYRGYSNAEYIGLYKDKAVQFIGEVKALYDCESENRDDVTPLFLEGTKSDKYSDRIISMIKEAPSTVNWDLHIDTRFFCMPELIETNYRKISSGGIMGHRYHDITEIYKKSSNLNDIAKQLSEMTWE